MRPFLQEAALRITPCQSVCFVPAINTKRKYADNQTLTQKLSVSRVTRRPRLCSCCLYI